MMKRFVLFRIYNLQAESKQAAWGMVREAERAGTLDEWFSRESIKEEESGGWGGTLKKQLSGK